MKKTSGILCALLAICYISPSNGKSIEKCQRELGLNDDMCMLIIIISIKKIIYKLIT